MISSRDESPHPPQLSEIIGGVFSSPPPIPAGAFDYVVGVACRIFLRISFDAQGAAENYDRKEKQRKK